jgi:hypothetical protein
LYIGHGQPQVLPLKTVKVCVATVAWIPGQMHVSFRWRWRSLSSWTFCLSKAMTGGVGSTANVTYYANVTIDIGNGISFPAYAGFTEGMNTQGIGLLGQADFFSIYNVAFCQKQGAFVIDIP